ncbi:RICIN domain-containing protein [Streptomyces sp. 1331.2]|uniref:RICIN domain-containing protein n=1 Tax=Streptomyces sp. 1331.2 TaxID=1938835 RepID=UPI000BCD0A0E|nr:RICIN domain-containing protein [Streptomyces sp. 1331.2]SOB82735.1 Ricin-type beta-trefoil lectin domain-like [Streptomyces sp. 1331.2]
MTDSAGSADTAASAGSAITDGSFLVRNVGSGLLLQVAGASRRSGARIVLGPDDGTDNQLWHLTAVHPGGALFHIENAASGKRLDVTGASPDDGVPIQQWGANAFGAQEWLLEGHVDAPGTYTVTSFISGKPLTAPEPPEEGVRQWEDTDSPTQWWRFEWRG